GHRVYPVASVPRLRRVAEALARGHRAGEVVCASEDDLAALLGTLPALAPTSVTPEGPADPEELLGLVARFDGAGLTRALAAEWGRLGPLAFLGQRAAPLVHAVGDAWASGRLEIRHEHFLSERLGDLLRAYRMPYEERARGPLVVLATLPAEAHALGLQMAALVVAMGGCRVCYVGTEVPVEQLANVASDLGARAVGVSVSALTRGVRATRQLGRLRALLASRVLLIVGGDGAPAARPGVRVLQDFGALRAWTQTLANGAGV
ncbi:MAG: cobalamin-dependent protein, partial [Candidatus Binatia bacterium]